MPIARIRTAALGAALLSSTLLAGCWKQPDVSAQEQISRLRDELRQKNETLVQQRAQIDTLRQQLDVARGISEEDLKRIFYPAKIVIGRLTGGSDYDGQPGDDGVTVYLEPVDTAGDVVKVAGDVRIQLYDLAAPPDQQLIGEYSVPVDQIGKLWHGKLMAHSYVIKCPWPDGPPEHNEITVRVVFVDYLTKRVLTAQKVCKVELPP
jgi:hypothetical protein